MIRAASAKKFHEIAAFWDGPSLLHSLLLFGSRMASSLEAVALVVLYYMHNRQEVIRKTTPRFANEIFP